MAGPLRLNNDLIVTAEKEAALQKRSVPRQIEYWAELGRAVESVLDPADVHAIKQGLKFIKVVTGDSSTLDSSKIFNTLEKDRKKGNLSEKVTSSSIYYEASEKRPGLIDRVDNITGRRETGRFINGEFKILK